MNLLMIAPLMDSRGTIRYFIGAQVDVSGLIKDCSELEALARLVEKEHDPKTAAQEEEANRKDEFQELSEMLNGTELETIRRHGGRMHREYVDESDADSIMSHGRPRLLLTDPTQDILDRRNEERANNVMSATIREKTNGRLEGVYQHVRISAHHSHPHQADTGVYSTCSFDPLHRSVSSSPLPPFASQAFCNRKQPNGFYPP